MSNSFMRAAVAAGIGGMLGFLAVRLNDIGWAFSAATVVVLSAYYVVNGRRADVAWLLVAAGLVPGLFLARGGFIALVDPAVEVGLDTWIMLAVATAVAAVGALVVYTATSKTRIPPRHR